MDTVDEFNELGADASRRSEWDSLLQETPGATFFHTLDWLAVYWRHFGHDCKLRVLRVSRAGQLVGILPLVVRRESRKVGTVRVLTYPLHDWGSFYGPLGNQPEATLAAGLHHILRSRREWDVLELRWVQRQDALAACSQNALRQAGCQAYERVRAQTALIHLPGDWQTYFTSISKKFRESHRRLERKLKEQGEVTYLTYRPRGAAHGDCDPRWDLFEQCTQLASKSWQGASQDGTTLSHESIRGFLRDVHETAARVGALDMHLMYLGGEPLGFVYNYHWRGSVFGLRMGYNSELSRNSVGNHLTLHAVQQAIERGDSLYDLGPGSLDYKKVFASEIVDILQYSHYHPLAPQAQALRLNHCLTQLWPAAQSAPAAAE